MFVVSTVRVAHIIFINEIVVFVSVRSALATDRKYLPLKGLHVERAVRLISLC